MLNNKQFKLLLENIQSRKDMEVLLNKYKIENYIINDNGSVDVNGNVLLSFNKLTKLPFKFNKIKGIFDCSNNQLISLEGAPQEVEGDFDCQGNQLINLIGASQKVEGNFSCSNNQLTSLKGAPQEVGGDFDCSFNFLYNLKGAPQKIEGNFDCQSNQFTSLVGAPEILIGEFLIIGEEWMYLKPSLSKQEKEEVSLDDMTDEYGGGDEVTNIKDYLYKNNRLIKF